MKLILCCLLGISLELFALEAQATVPGDTRWKSDSDKIAAYFQEEAMQSHMGSMMFAFLGQNSSVLAALIAHQLEFDSSHAQTIFRDGIIRDKRAFLPLIRREVNAPDYNPDALALLSELEPEEARPLIVADIQRSKPLFQHQKAYYFNLFPFCYLHLPDQAIPELTPYFHEQLQHPGENLDYKILRLVDRYGTRDLLPDVLRIYQPYAGKGVYVLEIPCLRFWIRCDRPKGLEALISSQKSRNTGWYRSLLIEVSDGRWDKDMQNLALTNLTDPDPEIAAIAISLLERSGDKSVGEAVASTYIELVRAASHDKNVADAIASCWTNPSSGARILMDNKRFQLSDEQKRSLSAIASEDGH